MRKYIFGFFMAWGCFCSIPCPVRKWDEKYRGAMIDMLPAVGAMLGIITALLWKVLFLLHVGPVFTGIAVTAAYFCLTGFIHLDGFMDCCDAILSRRPDLKERQRILKDSHVGSFAVISLLLMMMLFSACMIEMSDEFSLHNAQLLVTALTWSRAFSVYDIRNSKPMEQSQYSVRMDGSRYTAPAAAAIISLALHLVLVFDFSDPYSILTLASAVVMIVFMRVFSLYAGKKARKLLGGMNGDISGYMIVLSELASVILMVLIWKAGGNL